MLINVFITSSFDSWVHLSGWYESKSYNKIHVGLDSKMTSIDVKWIVLPQDKSAWIIMEYICWLPNLVHWWHLRWSSSWSLIKWLQTGCLVEVFWQEGMLWKCHCLTRPWRKFTWQISRRLVRIQYQVRIYIVKYCKEVVSLI